MTPLNILLINWRDLKNPKAGGAEVHAEENFRGLVKMGHRVTLLCSNYPGGKKEDENSGLRIIRRGTEYTFNFVVPLAVKKLLKEENYDLVVEDINKIPFFTPLFHSCPVLVLVPHLFADSVFKEINPILGTYIYLAEKPIRRVYRGCKFVVISESTRQDLIRRGLPERDIFVSLCGIDHALYCPDQSVKKTVRPSLVYLGRLKKYKSVDHLIKALPAIKQKIPEVEIKIIGQGDDRGRLEQLTRALHLESAISFLGYLTETEKVNWLRRAHVVVCPSLKEGWGLTNIEANACGTPTVAAAVPGLRDSVLENESGLLYPYGDISALAERICRILTDNVLKTRLRQGALAWAQKFHWEKAARELEEIIARVTPTRTTSQVN